MDTIVVKCKNDEKSDIAIKKKTKVIVCISTLQRVNCNDA